MPITYDDLPFVSSHVVSVVTGAVFKKGAGAYGPPATTDFSNHKTVDVKANPEGDGVVFLTRTDGFTPKDAVVEETKEGSSLKEYHGFVETVCKAAGREDLIRYVYSKVLKIVKSELEE